MILDVDHKDGLHERTWGVSHNSYLIGLFTTMRPQQWTKNLIVFAALIFTGKLLQPGLLLRIVLVAVCFCLISSGVSIMNDLLDLKKDRQYLIKRLRLLARGEFKLSLAVPGAVALLAAGLSTAFWLDLWVGMVCTVYLAQYVTYSFYLKNLVIIDVMVLALGFLLRIVAGGIAIGVQEYSPWLYVCVTLLGLFLGFGKRRHELALLKEQATDYRSTLGEYNLVLIDQLVALVTTSTFITYTLYSLDSQTALVTDERMLITVPFVFYFIVRYLYLIHERHLDGAPDELLLKDKPLLINSGLWMLTVLVLLYVL